MAGRATPPLLHLCLNLVGPFLSSQPLQFNLSESGHTALTSARPYRTEHVRAVVALAPTPGVGSYGREQLAMRANRLTVPMLLTAGRGDNMG